jgi:hypothetical protein
VPTNSRRAAPLRRQWWATGAGVVVTADADADVQGREGKGAWCRGGGGGGGESVAFGWLRASASSGGGGREGRVRAVAFGRYLTFHRSRSRCRSGRWHAAADDGLTSWIAAFDATRRQSVAARQDRSRKPATARPPAPVHGVRKSQRRLGGGSLWKFLACGVAL